VDRLAHPPSRSRRRKRTRKTTISTAISALKNAETATRKKYSASMFAACSDACSGKERKVREHRLDSVRGPRLGPLAPQADEQERQEPGDGRDEPDADPR
jgi:hypothetical protein